jgi:hypothetical protein
MAQVVVIGMQGDDNLWIADFEQGTLSPMTSATAGAFKDINAQRASGSGMIRGIDFAVPISATASVSAGHLDG